MSLSYRPLNPMKWALAATALAGLTLSGCLQDPAPLQPEDAKSKLTYAASTQSTPGNGGLVGTFSAVTQGTTLISGVTEWNHYGATVVSTVTKGVNSPNQILKTNNGTINQFQPSPLPTIKYFNWSNSVPSSPSESRNGILAANTNDGFTLQLPASSQARTALVYVTVYKATGTFTATIPNESFPAYSVSLTAGSTEGYKTYCLMVNYKTLTTRNLILTWKKSADFGSGYVVLHAASYNNYTDKVPNVNLKLWSTPESESGTWYEPGMHVVGHQFEMQTQPVDPNELQPEGIKSILLYQTKQDGTRTYYWTSVQPGDSPNFPTYYGKRLVAVVPDMNDYTFTTEVTDYFGNVTTATTPKIQPWFELGLKGPANIPDNNQSGVMWAADAYPNGTHRVGILQDLRVKIDISHTWDADLYISLWDFYNNKFWDLTGGQGGSGDNFTNTVFSPIAGSLIMSGTAPFTGSYRPFSMTVTMPTTQQVTGSWLVNVLDVAPQDVGVVNSIKVLSQYR